MNFERLRAWLEEAETGATIRYMQADFAGRRPELRDLMWEAAVRGDVCLFQKRVRPGVYNYMAKKVSRRTGRVMSPWSGEY